MVQSKEQRWKSYEYVVDTLLEVVSDSAFARGLESDGIDTVIGLRSLTDHDIDLFGYEEEIKGNSKRIPIRNADKRKLRLFRSFYIFLEQARTLPDGEWDEASVSLTQFRDFERLYPLAGSSSLPPPAPPGKTVPSPMEQFRKGIRRD